MREIALDTETTGLKPNDGDRIVEIGCVEMINHVSTGKYLQLYINPERDMPEEAFRVHGLSKEFLSDKPVFADVADEFLNFIGDADLVIHNAAFDMGFINAELTRMGRPAVDQTRAIDTVMMARKKFPGSPANLDALCRRFQIDNSNRTLHGALLDAELLAEVYLELKGGRQQGFALAADQAEQSGDDGFETSQGGPETSGGTVREPRPHAPAPEELTAHQDFIQSLTNPVWLEDGAT